MTAFTAGPVRPGLAFYGLGTDGDFGEGGGFTAFAEFDGVSCSAIMCGRVSSGQVPFILGVPFQLEIIAGGTVNGRAGFPSEGSCGGGTLQLQLWDASPIIPVEILPGRARTGTSWACRSGAVPCGGSAASSQRDVIE